MTLMRTREASARLPSLRATEEREQIERIYCVAREAILAHLMPVVPADHRGWVVADRQPALRPLSRLAVDGRIRSAHAALRPTVIDSVAQDVGPSLRQGESERHDKELALTISSRRLPTAVGPVNVAQRAAAGMMIGTAQIDQPVRALDQRGHDIRRERVDI